MLKFSLWLETTVMCKDFSIFWNRATLPPLGSPERILHRIFKRLNTYRTLPPPRHVLAILNGIVNLPDYILTNSHFQLQKNEIVMKYLLIVGNIIYGTLNLFFTPSKRILGGGKNFLGGSICPPPRHSNDVPASGSHELQYKMYSFIMVFLVMVTFSVRNIGSSFAVDKKTTRPFKVDLNCALRVTNLLVSN